MTLFRTLIDNLPRPPPKSERDKHSKSPIQLFRALTWSQYAQFGVGFCAWVTDAYDFFSVSLSVNRLAADFGKTTHDITTSITLTLLFRSLGAAVFGLLSDRYGRKWPLFFNLLIIAALELGTAFVKNYSQFLAVRSLFGIGMGGIWGLSAATGLENMPTACRGIFSGILQEGYALGYLIAASVNLSLVPRYDRWQPMFYLGAGLSVFAASLRLICPESQAFLSAKKAGETGHKNKTFLRETGRAIKKYYWRCIYGILLMTGFNFFSHGSQDLYPVFMENAKGFSAFKASQATIVGNCGAILGGVIFGYASQYLGRRLTIIVACIWAGCFIPLWILPDSFGGLAAGAFMVQVLLNELSPPAFRAVYPGLAYQLGNMASSASSQIEATAGEHLRINYAGKNRPDYGKIQAILIGVVAGYIILLCLIGPENHGVAFEASKPAIAPGSGAGERIDTDDSEKLTPQHDEEASIGTTHGQLKSEKL